MKRKADVQDLSALCPTQLFAARHPVSFAGPVVCLLLATLCGCRRGLEPVSQSSPGPGENGNSANDAVEAARIIERYRSLDNSRTSIMRLLARIHEADGTAREVQLTIFRKRQPDRQQCLLVQFVSPQEERDRDGLITINPGGEIEAVRYMQSTGEFITTGSAAGEDSLFGMSLQELVGGQPEKYEFRLDGETTVADSPVYRVEGRLKQGADSKFPRMVLLISKENYAALVVELYGGKDLARRLTVQRIEQVGVYWTRMGWTLDNVARGKTIHFETIEVKYDQQIPDSVFSREHLKKVSSK